MWYIISNTQWNYKVVSLSALLRATPPPPLPFLLPIVFTVAHLLNRTKWKNTKLSRKVYRRETACPCQWVASGPQLASTPCAKRTSLVFIFGWRRWNRQWLRGIYIVHAFDRNKPSARQTEKHYLSIEIDPTGLAIIHYLKVLLRCSQHEGGTVPYSTGRRIPFSIQQDGNSLCVYYKIGFKFHARIRL